MSVLEIARRAGVSAATVSRVLNNHPRVKPETAEQVRRVLADVRYAHAVVRRGPRPGRRERPLTGAIGVLAVGLGQHSRFRISIFASVLSGVMAAARQAGLNVIVDEIPGPPDLSAAICRGHIDGALVLPPTGPEAAGVTDAIRAVRGQVPVVRVMGELVGATTVDHVGPDNSAVGHLAYEYLAGLGRRDLAVLTTVPAWDVNRSRAMAFLAAARNDGVVPTCYLMGDAKRLTEAEYCAAADVVYAPTLDELADRIAAARPRHTGLFATRDADAVHMYPRLAARGVRVGHDLTFVACDNDNVRLSMLHPRPASIDLNPEEVGRRAVGRLVARIRKSLEPPVRMLVVPRLVLPVEAPGQPEALPS